MLPKSKMVKKALETLYNGICTVTVHREYEKDNGATGFRDEVVIENEPCHLSISNKSATQGGQTSASVSQITQLFIRPDVDIPSGSKITVTQNGRTTDYTRSGQPAVYDTHQEIVLELMDRWS